MKSGGYHDEARIPGQPKGIGTAVNFISSGYLEALGVPIIAGRGITEGDVRTQAGVAVVSEDFGKQIGRSPLGLTIEMEDKTLEIVGVAARARYSRLTDQPNVLYLPNSLSQDSITVLLRTAVPPMQIMRGVREAVGNLDANLPIVNPVTMEGQIAATLRRERLFAWLCGSFGALALLLCMIGLYGLISYATSRRRQEIGIRMALGASPGNVLRQIVGEGMGVVLAGCVLGFPIAWWAAQRYVDYKRLGMEPLDPAILAWATAALAGSDPMKALREG
jgi:ABC-type antimicrobial peptide transport system permease subunit